MTDRNGTVAPPFALKDVQGHCRQLDDYRGSWLALVFHRHLG